MKSLAWKNDTRREDSLSLLTKFNVVCNDYRANQFAAQVVYAVLRLLSYHCKLKPIELKWSYVLVRIASENKTLKNNKLEPLMYEAAVHVTT